MNEGHRTITLSKLRDFRATEMQKHGTWNGNGTKRKSRGRKEKQAKSKKEKSQKQRITTTQKIWKSHGKGEKGKKSLSADLSSGSFCFFAKRRPSRALRFGTCVLKGIVQEQLRFPYERHDAMLWLMLVSFPQHPRPVADTSYRRLKPSSNSGSRNNSSGSSM